jgi:hypothetical protein
MLPDSHLEKAGYLNGIRPQTKGLRAQELPKAAIFRSSGTLEFYVVRWKIVPSGSQVCDQWLKSPSPQPTDF